LYYREPNFNAKIMESYDNDSPIDVLNKIKNNPNKNYILSFW
jgi:hypothetical protein